MTPVSRPALFTYLTTIAAHGLTLDVLREAPPPAQWKITAPAAARHPVYLTDSCSLRP